jgi:rhodanese-related sulfurtransferase/phosphohistidine phosphatase SixA
MRTRIRFSLVRLLAVSPFLLAPSALDAQEVIYVTRHAEQVEVGDDPPLTQAGLQRAHALAEFVQNAGITAIYTTEAERTRQTAEPVAAALRLSIRQVPREDTDALIARLRQEEPQGRVLVVGHSRTVPRILKALGYPKEITIDKQDYADVFVVVPNSEDTPLVLHQRLVLPQPNIFGATLLEPEVETPNISTEQMLQILAEGRELVLDVRPHQEWATSHVPGAKNVAPKPGVPISLYTSDVAEIERLTDGDKTTPLVLYCNGPFCGKSKRVTKDLRAAGYTNVRRYQLGAPVWRALGGVMVIEPDGARYVYEKDATAVWIDTRGPEEFAAGSVPRAVNIPHSRVLTGKDVGEVREAKDDGRLPMEDHNTRIIVFGANGDQAQTVAEAIAREAFHNVCYFEGNVETLKGALR